MNEIKILIVDDHPMMREALLFALENEPDLTVVGETDNGEKALELAAVLEPDVVLMDLLMPKMTGLEAITRLQEAQPQIKIMVVTSMEDQEKILAAVQAGALGYFPKTAPRNYLLNGIRMIADGVPYLPNGIAAKLFKSLREMKAAPTSDVVDEPLTARQEEVLALLSEGRSDEDISEILHLSKATVRSHVHNIIRRLGVENRAQAAAYTRLKKNRES